MPYIIIFTWYPPSQANNVAKKYLKTLQKLPIPSIVKRVVPASVSSDREGIEVMVIDEVKREDLGEALDYASKFIVEFWDIEGFRYQIKVSTALQDAMKYIGM